MSSKKWSRRGSIFLFSLIFACLVSGCMKEKAEAARRAALQFRQDAQEANSAIQALFNAEIASPPRTEIQRSNEFVDNILSLPNETLIDSKIVDQAADPYSVQLSSQAIAARSAFFNGLNTQYQTFASMFDNLERGNFLAKDKVTQTKVHTARLTAQVAAFGIVVQENPPTLIQRRTALITKINKIRKDPNLNAEQKREAMADMLARWDFLLAEESAQMRTVAEKCALAAASGQVTLELIDSYNKLSIEDIGYLVEQSLSWGEAVSGKSLGALRQRSQKALSFLDQNPEYEEITQMAIDLAQKRMGQEH